MSEFRKQIMKVIIMMVVTVTVTLFWVHGFSSINNIPSNPPSLLQDSSLSNVLSNMIALWNYNSPILYGWVLVVIGVTMAFIIAEILLAWNEEDKPFEFILINLNVIKRR